MDRPAVIGGVTGTVLLVAGILVSAIGGSGGASFTIGLAAVGVGAVILASVFFYAIGLSEDRDRERRPLG
jgi:hypothetical protein